MTLPLPILRRRLQRLSAMLITLDAELRDTADDAALGHGLVEIRQWITGTIEDLVADAAPALRYLPDAVKDAQAACVVAAVAMDAESYALAQEAERQARI